MKNPRTTLITAVAAAIAVGAVGGGIAIAGAHPTPLPASPSSVDLPEPGDTPDAPGDVEVPPGR